MPVVTCVYCQEKFDREKVRCQKIGRRYAHLTCHEPRIDVDGPNFNQIIQYCSHVFGENANFGRIGKQVKDYIQQGMTYNGIYLSIKYWYEIKKESTEKSGGGIGIVPYIYKEAKEYWKAATPTRIPKIEEEIVVIKHKPRKNILEELLEG